MVGAAQMAATTFLVSQKYFIISKNKLEYTFFIELGGVHPRSKIANTFEWTIFVTLRNYIFLNKTFTHIFDARKPETNSLFATHNTKIAIRLINIRTKYPNAHVFTFTNLNR